jgi:hypothetical protein
VPAIHGEDGELTARARAILGRARMKASARRSTASAETATSRSAAASHQVRLPKELDDAQLKEASLKLETVETSAAGEIMYVRTLALDVFREH